jgi:phosphonoacetate hydrolase
MRHDPREAPVHVNGIAYRWPEQPVVVICADGGDPAYLDQGLARGGLPNFARLMGAGFSATAEGTVPSFTCPNNMSIITGAPASVHGISGNYYLDRTTGEAVVMTGPELLRAETILAGFERAGARVVSITAKDKLRRQLGKGLTPALGSICFSAEAADRCTRQEHGVEDVLGLVGAPRPEMYSMELSLFVLDAGARLLERDRPDLMYLSLTDWVQHKYPPGSCEANQFYRLLDQRIGWLIELGALVAVTADHGMSDKSRPDGSPNVIWLQDELDREFGRATTRVICPITDAFVAHHGSLGGFVRVYCSDERLEAEEVRRFSMQLPGVEAALDRETVCRFYDLPDDREGDVAVIAEAGVAIGSSERDHDLTPLGGQRLRSHGGIAEARVPFIVGRPLSPAYRLRSETGVKSHQIFEFAINGCID